ncbi:hypothetical protein LCGC14_1924000, partial [marine sediment metagenome]
TGQQWYRLGAEELEAGEQGSHVAFTEAVNAAHAEMVDVRLTRIDEAGAKGQWQADMTVLERRMPQDFGRFQRVEVESKSISISLSAQLPPEAVQSLLDIAQRAQDRGAKFLPPGAESP